MHRYSSTGNRPSSTSRVPRGSTGTIPKRPAAPRPVQVDIRPSTTRPVSSTLSTSDSIRPRATVATSSLSSVKTTPATTGWAVPLRPIATAIEPSVRPKTRAPLLGIENARRTVPRDISYGSDSEDGVQFQTPVETLYDPVHESHPRGVLTTHLIHRGPLAGSPMPRQTRFLHRGFVTLSANVVEHPHFLDIEAYLLRTTDLKTNDSRGSSRGSVQDVSLITFADIDDAIHQYLLPFGRVIISPYIPPAELFQDHRRAHEWYSQIDSFLNDPAWRTLVLYIDFYIDDQQRHIVWPWE